jgi:hypothetical protein
MAVKPIYIYIYIYMCGGNSITRMLVNVTSVSSCDLYFFKMLMVANNNNS